MNLTLNISVLLANLMNGCPKIKYAFQSNLREVFCNVTQKKPFWTSNWCLALRFPAFFAWNLSFIRLTGVLTPESIPLSYLPSFPGQEIILLCVCGNCRIQISNWFSSLNIFHPRFPPHCSSTQDNNLLSQHIKKTVTSKENPFSAICET